MVGNLIEYQLYNEKDSRHYGPVHLAEIIEETYEHFEGNHQRPYHVERKSDGHRLWIKANEIVRWLPKEEKK